jgi:hypothetical protein
MPLQLGLLEKSDIPAFAAVDDAAMEHWGLARAMTMNLTMPRKDQIVLWTQESYGRDSLEQHLKVTDDTTNEIIACAFWRIQPEPTKPEPEREKIDGAEVADQEAVSASRATTSIGQEMARIGNEIRAATIGDQPHASE